MRMMTKTKTESKSIEKKEGGGGGGGGGIENDLRNSAGRAKGS